ncbi:MAG TPA: DNA polymerase III subunit epsilon [Burkholderiaceae bacterium]|nr:DNA polymerase III subunit epsilon [Burkholderiaceae bacterium]
MRQVVLDTETTGLEVKDGHRIIEIGCVELVGRRLTERRLHHYVNPGREIDAGALAVHGLRDDFLADKPRFAGVVDELLAYVRDAEVIIHNAPFDLLFLDTELALLGRPPFSEHCVTVTDTLRLARDMHPGKRNSLDALCERYGVSNRHRTMHGALLDAGLLAEVYLAMTRGQDSLVIELAHGLAADAEPIDCSRLFVLQASAEELAAHEAVLDSIAKECRQPPVWRSIG